MHDTGGSTVGQGAVPVTKSTGILDISLLATGTPDGTKFVRDDGTLQAAGGGSGTVTSVSVVTANGVSGSVATATTTPAITLTLGAIAPTTVNGVTITTSTGTFTLASGKTFTVSNTLTFTGTDSSTVACGAGGTVAYVANKLSVFAATSSSELAGVISDETGTGLLVFGTAPVFASTITIGTAAGTTGAALLRGTTSGTVTLTVAAAAGTWTMTLPTTDGDSGQFLQTNGSGVCTWAAATAAPGGSTTQLQYNNAGAFGGIAGLTFATGTISSTLPLDWNTAGNIYLKCAGTLNIANVATDGVRIGDPFGDGNGTILLVDDQNIKATCNKDFEVSDNSYGFVLQSPDTTRWRISVSDAGVLSTAAI